MDHEFSIYDYEGPGLRRLFAGLRVKNPVGDSQGVKTVMSLQSIRTADTSAIRQSRSPLVQVKNQRPRKGK